MKEIERRALMGDKEAQRVCTEHGIVLPCPICHNHVKVSASKMLYACASCHITVSFNSFNVNPEETLKIWNTRTAPPIGRCKDCVHSSPRMVMGNKTYGKVCKIDPYLVHEVNPDGYCDGFKPKEAPNG